MKTIYKSLIAAVALTPALTSCIEEVFPTDGVTEEQLTSSSKATEALVWGMAAFYNNYQTITSNAYDWGYGSIMHIRDVMTEDMAIVSSGYDWYTFWETDQSIGPDMLATQFIWNFYTQLVLTTNNTIGAIDPETANATQLVYLGMGHAFRASHYLDMARMYEFLPNEKTQPFSPEGKPIDGLTVPIVTQDTDEETARNNPRATRDEMKEFILSDLEKAEEYIGTAARASKTQPNLAVVYGLYARLYMWLEEYPLAAEYARNAITLHGAYNVTSESEWLSTTNGFNTLEISGWMWGAKCMKEDNVVQSGILNWTSWMSNETTYGYASAGPMVLMNKATYDRINNADFRKLSYIAPEGSPLAGKEPVIDEEWAAEIPPYGSLKFRPGEGNMTDYNVGSATAYPLMRVEEMYFIEAEATAHSSAGQGLELLQNFMRNFRYAGYTTSATSQEDVIEEIIFQKRIELWGEGQNFFDLKRLGYSVTRAYDGTNFYDDAAINTNGRPAWVNFCIVQTEGNNNEALRDTNNPNPSDLYAPSNQGSEDEGEE